MVFSSPIFLYGFLPLFLAAYYLTPRGWRSWVLTAASYVFYGWWRPDFVLLMLVSTLVDYNTGRRVGAARARGADERRWVVLSCVVNLGLLAYFKYANFGIDSLNAILESSGRGPIPWVEVVLPVGISFYTFQTISYTVDVYRGHAEPVRRFGDFACYVAMFPQLVAGPIVRYRSVAEQLHTRQHTWSKFALGMVVFQAGLAKKVLIADSLAPVADAGFAAPDTTVVAAWLAALAYTFQIYFDFSGYSDMAIGLGLMLAFRLPVNFDRPYVSKSITEFWRRWHISLSSFLRDYLYVPLGGNRKGAVRTYVNLALTMLLGGLWHGAAWTFVVWGAYQGTWLVIERLAGKKPLWSALPPLLQNAATFIVVIVGWVFFRATSLGEAGQLLGSMIGTSGELGLDQFERIDGVAQLAFVSAILITWGARTTQEHARRPGALWTGFVCVAFIAALVTLHGSQSVPFLYFQF